MPDSGACGVGYCDGGGSTDTLAADSDFERTFGIVETCSTAADDDEVRVVLSTGTYHTKWLSPGCPRGTPPYLLEAACATLGLPTMCRKIV